MALESVGGHFDSLTVYMTQLCRKPRYRLKPKMKN
eukprot:SAG11_NODE_11666_length_745_cov_2.072755_1_plen_34_part_01